MAFLIGFMRFVYFETQGSKMCQDKRLSLDSCAMCYSH